MPTSTPFPPELQQFNVEIQSLLKRQNSHARSLYYFIKRGLKQFNLDSLYTEIDIFNQAYLRGVNLTKSGTAIKNPKAWMRTTAFNVIRELSRSHQRDHSVVYDELVEADQAKLEIASIQMENFLVSDEVIETDLQAVWLAWQELDLKDRLIIDLKFIRDLSWKEIRQHLLDLGEPIQTETALRKRGQRAIERLRKLYHQKRPSKSTTP